MRSASSTDCVALSAARSAFDNRISTWSVRLAFELVSSRADQVASKTFTRNRRDCFRHPPRTRPCTKNRAVPSLASGDQRAEHDTRRNAYVDRLRAARECQESAVVDSLFAVPTGSPSREMVAPKLSMSAGTDERKRNFVQSGRQTVLHELNERGLDCTDKVDQSTGNELVSSNSLTDCVAMVFGGELD